MFLGQKNHTERALPLDMIRTAHSSTPEPPKPRLRARQPPQASAPDRATALPARGSSRAAAIKRLYILEGAG